MKTTLKQLIDLLKHLDIAIRFQQLSKFCYLKTDDLKHYVRIDNDFYSFYSLDDLLRSIFTADNFIIGTESGRKIIKNIYQGCKTYEEAMIRKDLCMRDLECKH